MIEMEDGRKLIAIKSLHTVIWLFFNVVIFYMLYAAITGKLDFLLWLGFALILIEGLILLIFKMSCPLTLAARKYSDSTRDNFDIYLPNWLAKYNKLIYTAIFVVIIAITAVQIFSRRF